MGQINFEQDTVTAPTREVIELVRRRIKVYEQVVSLEESLNDMRAILVNLDEVEIPSAMQECGISEIVVDGRKCKVVDEVYTSIDKQHEGEAYDWLREHDAGDLIKSEVKATFGRGEDALASKAAKALMKLGIVPSEKQTVHYQTLNAYSRELIAKGAILPEPFFKVSTIHKAKFK